MKRFFSRNIHFIYALVVATAYICYHGYSFAGGDQEEHLPLVYKMFDPGLYKYDYYMSQESFTFSIRYFYVQVVYAVSKLVGVETAGLVLFFLCILLISYSFVKITAHLSAEKYTPFFAPLIFLLFYNGWTVGGNYFVLPILICSVFSMAICSFAFLQFFRKKYFIAYACLGIAGLFQVIIAIHVACIISVLLLTGEEKNKIKKVASGFFLFLLCAAPMLLPVLKHHFFTPSGYDKDFYAQVLYYFRNPNHYIPSWFFPRDYARFFLLSFLGFSCAWLLKLINRKQLFAMYAVVYGGAIIYFLLLEKFHIYPIGKIQWFRSTVWITAFSSLFMVIAAGKILNVSHAPGHPLGPRVRAGIFRNIKYSDRIMIPLLLAEVIMVLIIFNGAKIPIDYFNQRYELGNRSYSDMSKMHFWIAANTPKDAVILTEPGDLSFLCEAKRSMPVGYAAVIHEAFFMIPWYEKFTNIYGVKFDDVNKITSAKDAAAKKYPSYKFEDTAHLFNISYRIDNVTTCQYLDQLGPVVHQEGDYILTSVKR